MNREYHKWYSPSLGHDMELLVFGHGGTPVLVFPTSMAHFFEYEDRGMIAAISSRYSDGQLQAYCVDGIDLESWYNRHAHPRDRVRRQMQYEQYLVNEVLPLIRSKNQSPYLISTGCSFGGYHAVNFGLRRPDLVTSIVSMSGAFDIHRFLHGYWDENCYFNCPPDFMSNLDGGYYADTIRSRNIVLAAGDWDICLGENQRMSGILAAHDVPHTLDVWGGHVKHDWPLWHRMAGKYLW